MSRNRLFSDFQADQLYIIQLEANNNNNNKTELHLVYSCSFIGLPKAT